MSNDTVSAPALDLEIPAPVNPAVAALRVWLSVQGIPDCDCGYAHVDTEYEAHWHTGGERAPDSYPGYVITTVDAGCVHHGGAS